MSTLLMLIVLSAFSFVFFGLKALRAWPNVNWAATVVALIGFFALLFLLYLLIDYMN